MRFKWLILVLVMLVACQPAAQAPEEPETVCNPPYFEFKQGECCLDEDDNKICDRDEESIAEKPIPPTEKVETIEVAPAQPIQKALAKFKEEVDSYYYKNGTGEYYVLGERVRLKFDKSFELPIIINKTIRVFITDVYVNRDRREAIGYCDLRVESERGGSGFDIQRSRCAKISDMPFELDYDIYSPLLPEDWLLRYEKVIPTLVEQSDQYIKEPSGWKAVNPIVHFSEFGTTTILRLDRKTGLPLEIEKIDEETGSKKVFSYTYFVHDTVKPEDVTYVPFGK